MDKDRQVVIVGVGRLTNREKSVEKSLTPAQLVHEAAKLAAVDAGLEAGPVLADVQMVCMMDMFFEERWKGRFGSRPYANFPRTVANTIGARAVRDDLCWRSFPGGNGPQYVLNKVGELLNQGKLPQGPILIGGAEANHSFDNIARAGRHEELPSLGWCDSNEFSKSTKKPKVGSRACESQYKQYKQYSCCCVVL